jgi:hypothetical protein
VSAVYRGIGEIGIIGTAAAIANAVVQGCRLAHINRPPARGLRFAEPFGTAFSAILFRGQAIHQYLLK